MKKILLTLIALICFFSGRQNLCAQTVTNDLVGLGMRPELADYIAGILPAGSVLGNNTYLKSRNAANSADINVLKVTAGDDTLLNADSGDNIEFGIAGIAVWSVTSGADLTSDVTNGSNIVMNAQDKGIQILSGASLDTDVTSYAAAANTVGYKGSNSSGTVEAMITNLADATGGRYAFLKTRAAANSWNANTIVASGDDIGTIIAAGSDGASYIDAASILFEVGGTPGTNDMPGNIKFLTTADGAASMTLALTIEPDQDLLMTGDLYLADGQNLGFTGQSGANTACDTTCTGGCIAGWDTGTSVFVACTNAIADTCLCTK